MTPSEKTTPAAAPPAGGHSSPIPSLADEGAWGGADARCARAGYEIRCLRYFRDLLVSGYRAALGLDAFPGSSLRGERLALGIDFAELDTVALWSCRRDDGTLAIPFVEFLLGQFLATFETLTAELAEAASPEDWGRVVVALDAALSQASGGGRAAPTLPGLRDRFLPEPFLRDLCGPGGLLERTVSRCEELLFRAK
jgi:hypothetical protein